MKKILFIAGTRPEAIKLAPLYLEMRRRNLFTPVLCGTGQHDELFHNALQIFNLSADIMLNTMQPGQSLPQLTAELFRQLDQVVRQQQPDAIIVQGDTMSAFAGAWTGFLLKIPVVHIEAGLRTGDLANPFPEEANRRAISIIASYHAAPTAAARKVLIQEKVPAENIVVTGNTAIDAVYFVRDKLKLQQQPAPGARRILVTCHRRENFGAGLEGICAAMRTLAVEFPDVEITWVAHPNPAVADTPRKMLAGLPNIRIVPPLTYEDFVSGLLQAYLLITDSGGIQEEGPALGKPVLVTRHVTERPEAEQIGATRLVGTDPDQIAPAARELLRNPDTYHRMATAGSPYGTGTASSAICDFLQKKLL